MATTVDDDYHLENFWSAETIGTLSKDVINPDQSFLREYQENCVTRESDGAYSATFPWKGEHEPLPSNLSVCERRSRATARRLGNSPETLKAYGDFIIEQEQRGFIEKVPANDSIKNTHYIPHHPVWKDLSTTPREYLTSLRTVHSATGGNKQDIAEGQVMLVYDDKPRIA